MKRAVSFTLAIGVTVAPACAKPPPPVQISVACSSDGGLARVTVAGRDVVPSIDGKDAALPAALPDREARITIVSGGETPYRCIGGLVYKLQTMGYHRIEFLSEPPPPSE